jgi:hypothetical protein
MTDTTPKFEPITRLQQIAATIRERGAYTFDAPATAAYYIDCAIKEIERLHRDYSCVCNEMRRMMNERDEARREVCGLQPFAYHNDGIAKDHAAYRGWDCFQQEDNK